MSLLVDRETVDVPVAARRLGIDPRTAYEMIQRSGELVGIRAIRAGKRVLIPREPLDRLLAGAAPSDGEAANASH